MLGAVFGATKVQSRKSSHRKRSIKIHTFYYCIKLFLVLNQRRQDMDFAKHELKNAKAPEEVEMKNIVYENAQKLFESQLQKVSFYPSLT